MVEKFEQNKDELRSLIEKREQILSKLTKEEREELAEIEETIRRLTSL